MSEEHLEQYEQAMQPARMRFSTSPALLEFANPAMEPLLPELFLIQFCALGVAMTEPVEGWIRRAGERTEALGWKELGIGLQKHAQQEADHHELMIADTKNLVARWNEKYEPPLDAEVLIQQPITPGAQRYQNLHEDTIASDKPYAQVAIEYEIEMLSLNYGTVLLERCNKELGADVTELLSFLNDHVALDVGHTEFNKRQLSQFLESQPDALPVLVSAGEAALDAYAEFLSDCLGTAKKRAADSAQRQPA